MGTNGSFYQSGLPYGTAETGIGNAPPATPAGPANGSFYLNGSAYAQANPVAAAASASAAAASAAAAAASAASIPALLSTYAPLASPALTGVPTAPTATVGTNTTQLATTAFVLANAGSVGKNIVIYADGQSNISLLKTFTWSPNANVKLWNNTQDAINTGTAFAALSSTTIGIAEKFASDVADANPASKVYLIKNGYTGQPISHWLSGTGAPDLYANGTANLAAALTTISATKIDVYLRWQGEADAAAFNASYVANFATMMARYWGNSYFPQETPCIIMGISPASISGAIQSDYVNNFLRAVVSTDPDKRRFVYTASLSSSTYWDVTNVGHGTGQGYFSWGAMAANAFLRGASSRNVDNDPVTNAVTAGNPLFTSAPRAVNLSATSVPIAPISGTVDHSVGVDGGGTYYTADNYGGFGSVILGRASGGTQNTPTALGADKLILGLASEVFDGTGSVFTGISAAYQLYSNGVQSGTNHGTYGLVYLTPLNSTTVQQAYRLDVGGFTVNGATSGGVKIAVPAVAGSNTITLPAGTTDFSATGGTSQVVKQTSVGGAFTVAQLGVADVSGAAPLASPSLTTPSLGVATATTINGASLDNLGWTAYAPTITAGSGTFTTVSGAGRYKQIGKTVALQITVTITTVGTASSNIIATLPVNARASTWQVGSGRENNAGGIASCFILSSDATKVLASGQSGATLISAGNTVLMNITYEAA